MRSALAWGVERLGRERRRDVELLLRAATGWERAFLLGHDDAWLSDEAAETFRGYIQRRVLDEPVQYVLGRQEFWGLELFVTPSVLIPRPETEHLIEAVLARVSRSAELRISDVGTGSGAIAIALARELPLARIVATDISSDALHVAQSNAARHGVAARIDFRECDLLPAEWTAAFDVVASNPPYVAEGEREMLAREVREFEPSQALFAGADGLEIYRRLIPAARAGLRHGGWLVMEMGVGQGQPIQAMLKNWSEVASVADLQGIERVLCARKL